MPCFFSTFISRRIVPRGAAHENRQVLLDEKTALFAGFVGHPEDFPPLYACNALLVQDPDIGPVMAGEMDRRAFNALSPALSVSYGSSWCLPWPPLSSLPRSSLALLERHPAQLLTVGPPSDAPLAQGRRPIPSSCKDSDSCDRSHNDHDGYRNQEQVEILAQSLRGFRGDLYRL
jgi:hypothetical protein